ncbi:MAG: hypothetical protein AB4426_19810 [Xenococcaceae cyanobacterium]
MNWLYQIRVNYPFLKEAGNFGSGNREQGTGNGEQGTGIREQGTGNGEQGAGKEKYRKLIKGFTGRSPKVRLRRAGAETGDGIGF